MKMKIHSYYLLFFTATFIFFTIIGTLTHEYGHIIVAKYFGCETTLSYGSMTFNRSTRYSDHESIYAENKYEIKNNLPFPEKDEFLRIRRMLRIERLLITVGGPFQTILTGLFGLFLLYIRRKSIKTVGLKFIDWLSVFLSLFLLREVFNLVNSISFGLLNGTGIYFGGDEVVISNYFDLPTGTISIVLGVIGLTISLFVIFNIIPIKLRLTFIISGLIGGISGFVLWMKILGPMVLPC